MEGFCKMGVMGTTTELTDFVRVCWIELTEINIR